MNLLLDTHVAIWNAGHQELLSEKVLSLLDDPDQDKFISLASLWEMSIKTSLGKLKLPRPTAEIVADFLDAGLKILPITQGHIQAIETLPWIHRDPFDRMLIAQAQREQLTIITLDAKFKAYPVAVIW